MLHAGCREQHRNLIEKSKQAFQDCNGAVERAAYDSIQLRRVKKHMETAMQQRREHHMTNGSSLSTNQSFDSSRCVLSTTSLHCNLQRPSCSREGIRKLQCGNVVDKTSGNCQKIGWERSAGAAGLRVPHSTRDPSTQSTHACKALQSQIWRAPELLQGKHGAGLPPLAEPLRQRWTALSTSPAVVYKQWRGSRVDLWRANKDGHA